MNMILIVLWIMNIFLNGGVCLMSLEDGETGKAILHLIIAILWGICICLKFLG